MALSPKLAVKKKAALMLLLISLMAPCILKIQPSKADPKTIIVPDDYATIAAAIGNATDGDTIFVKKGIYEEETLEISKALFIIGQDVENTVVNLHPPLVTSTIFTQTFTSYANPVNIKADDVKLSGLTINSEGGEISATGNRTQITGNILNTDVHLRGSYQTVSKNNLTAGVTCSIGVYGNIYKNNVVNGSIGCVSGSYNRFFANNVLGGVISSGGTSSNNLIYGNTVKNGDGIWACSGAVVAKNTVTDSETGISVGWGFNNIICGNIITNNRGAGLTKLEGTNNTFYANYVANNSVGVEIGVISWQHSGNNTFYHNDFVQNIQQTKVINLDHSDYWDNGKEGNYWSNYTGSDANHDGLGDSPYVIFGERHTYDYPYTTYAESYEDRYPLMTPFNCSSITIELPEWATNQLPKLLTSPDITPPTISILSLENMSYPIGNLSLTFTASEPTSWIGYSLDGQENITVAGNTVLVGLFVGSHYLTVYANDTAGNTGISETIYFRIETPFPTTLLVAVAIIACVFGFGLIVNLVTSKKKKQ
jgi:nitrous oxidase accessory protein